jgi:hypothetical protein
MNRMKQLFMRRHRYDELAASIREHLDEKISDGQISSSHLGNCGGRSFFGAHQFAVRTIFAICPNGSAGTKRLMK